MGDSDTHGKYQLQSGELGQYLKLDGAAMSALNLLPDPMNPSPCGSVLEILRQVVSVRVIPRIPTNSGDFVRSVSRTSAKGFSRDGYGNLWCRWPTSTKGTTLSKCWWKKPN